MGDLLAEDRALQKLEGVWRRFVSQGPIVGGVLLLARHGRLIHTCVGGWADREARVPATRETVFRWASMTKLVTSVAALGLHEAGMLDLDRPVTDWLPHFSPATPDGRRPAIRLRHLMSHTAGLCYGFERPAGNPYHLAGVSDGLDAGEVGLVDNLRRIAGVPLVFEPGTAWQYSIATDVLGAVLEQATGMPLPDVIDLYVTRPLGMRQSGFRLPPGACLSAAYKDSSIKGPPCRVTQDDELALDTGIARLSAGRITNPNAYASGGAGMVGTADDYLRLLECLRTGGRPLLRTATTAMLLGNAIGEVPIRGRGPGWSFGLGPMVLHDPVLARHRQNPGTWSWCGLFGGHYWVDPVAGMSLVALTNTAVAGAWGPFADAIVSALYEPHRRSRTGRQAPPIREAPQVRPD